MSGPVDTSCSSTVSAAFALGAAAHPDLPLAATRFAAHVARHWPADSALAAMHAADLFLACASLDRLRAALARLENDYLAPALQAARRVSRSTDFLDEVRQRLSERLLVGTRPRLADYAGRGPLAGWLRVATVRQALNLRRELASEPQSSLAADEPMAESFELALLHERYRADVERAFAAALRRLDLQQRRILRLHFIDGLSFEAIGHSYRLDRSNVSRRAKATQRFLLGEIRRELARSIPMTATSLESLMLALRDQVGVNLESALRSSRL